MNHTPEQVKRPDLRFIKPFEKDGVWYAKIADAAVVGEADIQAMRNPATAKAAFANVRTRGGIHDLNIKQLQERIVMLRGTPSLPVFEQALEAVQTQMNLRAPARITQPLRVRDMG